MLFDENSIPKEPDRKLALISPSVFEQACDVTVKKSGGRCFVDIEVDKVQPRSTTWILHKLYVGAPKSMRIELKGSIRGDNIATPEQAALIIDCSTERRSITFQEILDQFASELDSR